MSKSDPQMVASGYERNPLDRYWTHPWMTNELFRLAGQFIPQFVWEPAAGRGDMSKAIVANGHICYSTDIDMSEFDENISTGHERSFLDEFELPIMTGGHTATAIITNPPYNEPWRGIADDFIRHFSPEDIMRALEERPQLRANILETTTGIKRKIAAKKSSSEMK